MDVYRTTPWGSLSLALWLLLGTSGLALVWAAQTPAPRAIEQAKDASIEPERDLSGYDRYAWSRDQEPAEDLATHLRLINAIQDRMKKQGLRIDPTRPEVRIRYRYEVVRGVEAQSNQQRSVWDPTDVRVEVDVRREERIRLQIELTEVGSGFLLWRAEGTYPMETADRLPRQLREVVDTLFEEWPSDEEAKDER